MLIDPKMYQIVEEALMKNGSIACFEREQGEIKGHMMVTLCNVPAESAAVRSSSKIQIIAGNSSNEPAKDMRKIRNIVPNKDSIIHLFPKEY